MTELFHLQRETELLRRALASRLFAFKTQSSACRSEDDEIRRTKGDGAFAVCARMDVLPWRPLLITPAHDLFMQPAFTDFAGIFRARNGVL